MWSCEYQTSFSPVWCGRLLIMRDCAPSLMLFPALRREQGAISVSAPCLQHGCYAALLWVLRALGSLGNERNIYLPFSRNLTNLHHLPSINDMKEAEALHGTAEEPKASPEALAFLSSIDHREVDHCLFVDSLVTVSDSGKELGEFCVSIQKASYDNEPCYMVHANSHGAIDNIPCGTSITAYVSRSLETLEENHHEYIKVQEHMLDRKVNMVRRDGCLVVNKVTTEKEEVKKQTFTVPMHSLQGFVSEATNFIILRILAQQKKIPEKIMFLSFNADTQLSVATYRELGTKKQVVGKEMVDVFGIEMTISSGDNIQASWHCYFLPDGHLASRVQMGSPVTMNLLQLPPIGNKEERDQKPVFEKKPLVWEEDMELHSKFLDRKEELKAGHSSYVRDHPELKTLLADFMQFLLLRKPQDVFSFAQDYFAPFDFQCPPDSSFKTSRNMKFPEVALLEEKNS